MSIQPQFRNQGIDSRILYTVEDYRNQCFFLQVTLKVEQDNFAARRFYDRLGYIIVNLDPGRWPCIDDKGKHRGLHEPAWQMIKELD